MLKFSEFNVFAELKKYALSYEVSTLEGINGHVLVYIRKIMVKMIFGSILDKKTKHKGAKKSIKWPKFVQYVKTS